MRLLASQTIEVPLQLGGPLGGIVCEAACTGPGPERATLSVRLLGAFAVAGIDPVTLRLPESFREIISAGFLSLRQQILVHVVEIRIILDNRAIEAAALIGRRRGVAIIA